ncbi:exodeoxyribonuclease VII small subunit [Planktothrix sp. FACHB-1355]|uniref:Exodeoxyribonuclease 7 small subunit n=1 Tax=Aerosakkonema funiforme FACHB-1375 TaxID=2949571 RepID=A0A926ZE14_9CYAN|nr:MULTISPECIES: exodeoxyribonuclease VII small subunit [Oscillatoriales]MBD2179588.1 exodeoxyribonuclease VII small subunit [Aerosakkonema funiforme FACHB-1375]MBD3560531.1 exodeoxyribonuclease VII small subunit [Planktothrix sp. FACHB-1355]
MINYPNSPVSANIPLEKSWNYEEAVTKVEKIIAEIESGKLELAQIFDEFAAAVEYLRQCETFLQEKQQQVDLLIETLVDEADSF